MDTPSRYPDGDGTMVNAAHSDSAPEDHAAARIADSKIDNGADYKARAYSFWNELHENLQIPPVEDLIEPARADFGPCSVVLDLSSKDDGPTVVFLGEQLAEHCGVPTNLVRLDKAPRQSILGRLPEFFDECLSTKSPCDIQLEIGSEDDGATVYRGTLLPFANSSNEVAQVIGILDWSDHPVSAVAEEPDSLELGPDDELKFDDDWLRGVLARKDELAAREAEDQAKQESATAEPSRSPRVDAIDAGDDILLLGEEMEVSAATVSGQGQTPCLDAKLDEVRELANLARSSEDRSHSALYDVLGKAYDFAVETNLRPDELARIAAVSGIKANSKNPMATVVRLIFGLDYEKTRLAEYAAALSFGVRIGVIPGEFALLLKQSNGGLKGIVKTERQMRREERGQKPKASRGIRETTAEKLRTLPIEDHDLTSADSEEFGLIMFRRMPDGTINALGEVPADRMLLERAAKKLLTGRQSARQMAAGDDKSSSGRES